MLVLALFRIKTPPKIKETIKSADLLCRRYWQKVTSLMRFVIRKNNFLTLKKAKDQN